MPILMNKGDLSDNVRLWSERFYQSGSRTQITITTALISACLFSGYLYYIGGMGFFSDDFFAFVHLSEGGGLNNAINALIDGPGGRPAGQFIWRLLHTLALPYDPFWLQAFAGVIVVLQCVVVYTILLKLKIHQFAAFVASLFMGLAPFNQSVYLPVHGVFTEFATILSLLAIKFILVDRPIFAAISAAVTITIYEHMLPLIPFIALLPIYAESLNSNKKQSNLWQSIFNKNSVYFSIMFILAAVLAFFWRGSGRANRLAGDAPIDIVTRMIEAANRGSRATIESISNVWDYILTVNGQVDFLPIAAAVTVVCVFGLFTLSVESPKFHERFWTLLVLAVSGVLIIYLSYFVLVTRFYTIDETLGRISNVHSTARLGYVLLIGTALHALVASKSTFAKFAALGTACFIVASLTQFSHAYGLENTRVWDRKVNLARAYALGCRANPEMRHVAVLIPDGFSTSYADPVLDWVTYRTPFGFFETSPNHFLFIVLPENHDEFLRRLEAGTEVNLTGMGGRLYRRVERNESRVRVPNEELAVVRILSNGALQPVGVEEQIERFDSCTLEPRGRFRELRAVNSAEQIGGG